jgi:simple sugar transport system permease protein
MATVSASEPARSPISKTRSPLAQWALDNRRALSALAILIVTYAVFAIANPAVMTGWTTIRAIFITLPLAIFLAVPLVFMVVGGEIDLSFPATMGVASYAFALAIQAGWNPFIAFGLAIVVGVALGAFVGWLVVYFSLSSLIATLGMNFLLRGLINISAQGYSIAFPGIRNTDFLPIFVAKGSDDFPVQMIWAVIFVIFGWYLFNRHQFGLRVKCVGDNPDSSAQMGINVRRVRITLFVFCGFAAAVAGVFSTLINQVWWPTTGDGFMLPALTSVFVGGTPAWGGVGTVVGGALGATIVRFIETGVVAAGLTGFYTQFFNGLIIILSLIGHRFNGKRHR